MPPSRAGEKLEAGISKPLIASFSSRGIKARGRDLQVPVSVNWLHLHHPCILGGPQQREKNQNSKPTPGVTMMHHATKRGFKDCPGFLNSTGRLGPKRGRKCYITPAFSGVPNKGGQNQNSKPTPGVTMMHHATKRGFKDCPSFLNSTGRLGPKRGRKCYVTPAFSGVPNKGGQNQNSKPPLGVTMMPLGAPSISKYGSLVRPDAQIVAPRAHCA